MCITMMTLMWHTVFSFLPMKKMFTVFVISLKYTHSEYDKLCYTTFLVFEYAWLSSIPRALIYNPTVCFTACLFAQFLKYFLLGTFSQNVVLMREKLKMLQEVAQWSQSEESIKYRSQSEVCVGGASLELSTLATKWISL